MTGPGAPDRTGVPVDRTPYEESAEELYERAPAGYVSTSPDGLIVKTNETLLSWLGFERSEVVGRKRLHDLLAPGARIYYETHYAPLLHMQGDVSEIAVELIRADGTRLPALLNSKLVRDEVGEPRVVHSTVFDATERRRYERELQRLRADAEGRARAALALAHVHDGVVLVTNEGRVDAVNPAAERIFGLTNADLLGRLLSEAVPGWEAAVQAAPVVDAGAATTPAVVPLSRGGHEQWLAVAGVDAGEGGIVWTLRDVTTDHALDQLRGELVTVVSHELRTPLTGVYGSAQTLLARYEELTDDVRRQLLGMLVEQADRLSRLVDRILLTSQLDAGTVDVSAGWYEASALVAATLETVLEAERARVTLHVGTGTKVLADPELAQQVLWNLLDNALKYSDGPIRVDVERSDGAVRFSVADEGPGIPPSEQERVFEKFFRLDPDQRRGVGGVGLGLYVARQLTKRLGGRIGLEARDRGTTVVVELPVADDGAQNV